jgi:orotate phosphoribosyltransferase
MSRLANHTLYLNELDPLDGIAAVKDATNAIRDLHFDAIAFSGMSGALVAPSVAMALRKPMILARKPTDDSHAGKGVVEGALDAETYIIIDDFMSSGDTIRRIHTSVVKTAAEHPYRPHKIICVGIYLYRDKKLYTAKNAATRIGLADIISAMPVPPQVQTCEYTGVPIPQYP